MVYHDHNRIKSVLRHREVGHKVDANLAKKAAAGRSDREKRRLDRVCRYFKLLTNSAAGHIVHQENLLWQNLQDLSKISSIYKDFTYFNPCTIHLVKYSSEFHQLR